jgi:hypothetical protein
MTRRWCGIGLAAVLAILVPGLAWVAAQTPSRTTFNVREVYPSAHVLDKPGIHTMSVNFKDPRTITVDVPGRGKKVVWYMWYQVYNVPAQGAPPEPFTVQPDFELVPLSGEGKKVSFHDAVMPEVQEAIRKQEGSRTILNSVTISATPIQATKPDSAPLVTTGIAIWPDVEEKAPGITRFSIFVGGFSDGWSLRTVDGKQVIERKTLQLNFQRLTDTRRTDAQDIKFLDPPQWIYRVNFADPIVLGPAPAPPPAPAKQDGPKPPG